MGAAARGGRGQVYRAVWKASIHVAVKRAYRQHSAVTDEMKPLVDLHHPHIVACYGILLEPGGRGSAERYSIVTERCCQSLRQECLPCSQKLSRNRRQRR